MSRTMHISCGCMRCSGPGFGPGVALLNPPHPPRPPNLAAIGAVFERLGEVLFVAEVATELGIPAGVTLSQRVQSFVSHLSGEPVAVASSSSSTGYETAGVVGTLVRAVTGVQRGAGRAWRTASGSRGSRALIGILTVGVVAQDVLTADEQVEIAAIESEGQVQSTLIARAPQSEVGRALQRVAERMGLATSKAVGGASMWAWLLGAVVVGGAGWLAYQRFARGEGVSPPATDSTVVLVPAEST